MIKKTNTKWLEHKLSISITQMVVLIVLIMPILSSCKQLTSAGDSPISNSDGRKSVILVIGDGMGHEHLRAASFYDNGTADGLYVQKLVPNRTITTQNASGEVTDSAASATAMATGVKVFNGVLSVELPGDGNDLLTITEIAKNGGKSIGIVTTAHVTHATPAAFGSHVANRSDYESVGQDLLYRSRPDIIIGGSGYGIFPDVAREAEYVVAESWNELHSMAETYLLGDRIAGLFGTGHFPYVLDRRPPRYPTLGDAATLAMSILSENPEGYVLIVEAARIDHAAHSNDVDRVVHETIELDEAVKSIMEHASLHEDVLVLVTADHETGGLSVLEGRGTGFYPNVVWESTGHTSTEVPLFVANPLLEEIRIDSVVDNADLFSFMSGWLE